MSGSYPRMGQLRLSFKLTMVFRGLREVVAIVKGEEEEWQLDPFRLHVFGEKYMTESSSLSFILHHQIIIITKDIIRHSPPRQAQHTHSYTQTRLIQSLAPFFSLFSPLISSAAHSLNNLFKIFPEAFLGIASTNLTPPSGCL